MTLLEAVGCLALVILILIVMSPPMLSSQISREEEKEVKRGR